MTGNIMTSILEASVYVGTYRKYNAGSIYGKWMKLSDYTTKQNFLKACKELHKDEHDPEFMFQDYEYIPSSMVRESYIDGEIWHVMNSLKKNASGKEDDFAQWCEEHGAEQDYDALTEYMGYNNNQHKQLELPLNPYQMSNEELNKVIDSLSINEKDRKQRKSITSNAAYFGDKLVLFYKPRIDTEFCFDDENKNLMRIYHEFPKDSETAREYFVNKNMRCNELIDLDYFLDDGEIKPMRYERSKLYIYKQSKSMNVYTIAAIEDYRLADMKMWYSSLGEFSELTQEQIELYHNLLLNEKDKFEKRLQQYLKRYGVKKCHTWSYWANA